MRSYQERVNSFQARDQELEECLSQTEGYIGGFRSQKIYQRTSDIYHVLHNLLTKDARATFLALNNCLNIENLLQQDPGTSHLILKFIDLSFQELTKLDDSHKEEKAFQS